MGAKKKKNKDNADVLYGCVKQQLKHLSKSEYLTLRELCHVAKNLHNEGVYNVRQHYFETGEFLSYTKNYQALKNSENYKTLNSNMAQQILMDVDESFKSFFALLRKAKKGEYSFHDIELPGYLPKDGHTTLIVGFVRIKGNQLILPYSQSFKKSHVPITITLPPILESKKISEIRIMPKSNARFFEIQYIYEIKKTESKLDMNKALAIDLGVSNLAACVTSTGESFIVDGKRLKSVNQWYNKENARLQGIKDKQGICGTTKRQAYLVRKRNNVVNDYIHKACWKIIDYCITHEIGNIVIGYNPDLQKNSNIGRRNNQNLVNVPVGEVRRKLDYLCKRYGINYVQQEESYTSKASFFDGDIMPIYGEGQELKPVFQGKRVSRGLYRTSSGYLLNADVNGALNILRKSNVVCLEALCSRGGVSTPMRIRVA